VNFDSNLKRYFPAVVCGLLALAAYFQASGIGELVGSTLGDAPATAPPRGPGSRLKAKARADGKPILARNPFDSITGPLDGRTPPPPPVDSPELDADGEASGDEPSCNFGRVTLIAASDDPEWSFAAIQGKSGGTSQLRRVGDTVDDHKVEGFAWDRVWLVKDRKRCQMMVGDKSNTPAKPAAKKPRKKRPPRGRNRGKLPAELAAKIIKVSDTEFNIERSVVDEILEKQAALMKGTRIRPMKEGDKVIGLKLSRVRPGTLMDTLGMKNGDVLQSINGFELTNPQKALEAYGRLRAADRLTLTLQRGGQPTNIDLNIQ
jgi:general secretion pathway protein C